MKTKILFVIAINLIPNTLFANSVLVYGSPFALERAKYRTENILKKIKMGGFKEVKKTKGFNFALKSKVGSLLNYEIFIGRWKKNDSTLIRLEGEEGKIHTLAQILEQEGIITQGSVLSDEQKQQKEQLKRKSIVGVIVLNFISPTFSSIYEANKSPIISKNDLTTRALVLFGVELGLVYIAGSNFLQTRFDYAANQNNIWNTLLLYRVVYTGLAIRSVVAHNRLIKLGYDFSY